MKRGLVLDYSMLERLADKPDYENIVVGAGALARDMRQKILLLGLKAPFLIGDRSEPEKGIRHYREIAGLGEPKRYRFIVCCDVDEWELVAPAQMAAYKFLGIASWNHPRLIRFFVDSVLTARTKYVTDAINCNTSLRNDHPYAVFGGELVNSFHIHLIGTCHVGGLVQFTPGTLPKLLQDKLAQAGCRATIHAWGQPNNPVGDNIIQFIRDISFHKCDLLILNSGAGVINPLIHGKKNLLATRAGSVAPKHRFIWQCLTYNKPVSNGLDHDVDLFSLRVAQQRIFIAFSRMYGFSFWDIFLPTKDILSENQAKSLRGMNPAYFARRKREKDTLLSFLDQRCTKDYTEIFGAVDDIHAMFADASHLSDAGSHLAAERLAAEILATFGKRSEGV